MLESDIRDLLAEQIEVLEPGLHLLDIERYIPNRRGTSGFIDLLARDKRNHWVLIELKRSDSSAREALHEILKYVEGVKVHLGARDDEIRVMIVSTEWRELLIPFSRFVEDTSIAVAGFKIEVDQKNTKITSKYVEPLAISGGRAFAPWHQLNFYTTWLSLRRGVRSYEAACSRKGIADYVLVLLRAPLDFHDRAKQALRKSLIEGRSQFQDSVDLDEIDRIVQKLERYVGSIRKLNWTSPYIIRRRECSRSFSRLPKVFFMPRHTRCLSGRQKQSGCISVSFERREKLRSRLSPSMSNMRATLCAPVGSSHRQVLQYKSNKALPKATLYSPL